MAKFRKVHTSFWDDEFIETLSPEDKYFYLFLITNPQSTECGIYSISKRKMSFYTGYNLESIDNILKRMISTGKVKYDETTGEVFLVNRAKYFPKKVGKPVLDCIKAELDVVKSTQFIQQSIENIVSASIRTVFIKSLTDRGTVREQDEDKDEDEKKESPSISPTNVGDIGSPSKKDFFERKEDFRKHVYETGRLTYTKLMLDRFFGYWAEPNGARGKKMKWEKERDTEGWDLERRLQKWAQNNYDNIVCFLSEAEKTIEQKKKDFVDSLAQYKSRYPSDVLNGFYREWAQPENVPNPQFLKWELEKFWDLGNKLAQYHTNWVKKQQFQSQR